jgi:hypothetical protein
MPSSGTLHSEDLLRTYVSEELITSTIKVTRLGELEAALAVTSNRSTLRRNTKSVLTRVIRRNIPQDGVLQFNSSLVTLHLRSSGCLDAVSYPSLSAKTFHCRFPLSFRSQHQHTSSGSTFFCFLLDLNCPSLDPPMFTIWKLSGPVARQVKYFQLTLWA